MYVLRFIKIITSDSSVHTVHKNCPVLFKGVWQSADEVRTMYSNRWDNVGGLEMVLPVRTLHYLVFFLLYLA